MKRAATSSLGLGGVATTLAIALLLSGRLEFLVPVAIAATFTFIIAWLNKGLVGLGEGRGALLVGVSLAAAGTIIGIGSLVAEIVS